MVIFYLNLGNMLLKLLPEIYALPDLIINQYVNWAYVIRTF